MTEDDAVKVFVAAENALDAAGKLFCFIGSPARVEIYRPSVLQAVGQMAEALGYELVEKKPALH